MYLSINLICICFFSDTVSSRPTCSRCLSLTHFRFRFLTQFLFRSRGLSQLPFINPWEFLFPSESPFPFTSQSLDRTRSQYLSTCREAHRLLTPTEVDPSAPFLGMQEDLTLEVPSLETRTHQVTSQEVLTQEVLTQEVLSQETRFQEVISQQDL